MPDLAAASLRPAIAALLAVSLGACQLAAPPAPALPASPAQLAADRRVQVGDRVLAIPVPMLLASTTHTGVRRPRTGDHDIPVSVQELLDQPADRVIQAAYVDVSLPSLGSVPDYASDRHVGIPRETCARIAPAWPREICSTGMYERWSVFHPRHFVLISTRYLQRHAPPLAGYAGDYDSVGAAALRLLHAGRFPATECQTDARGVTNSLCTAVERIDGDLLVVWSFARHEDPQAQAHRLRTLIGQLTPPANGRAAEGTAPATP